MLTMNDLILPIWGFSPEEVIVTINNLCHLKEKYADHLKSLKSDPFLKKENENGDNDLNQELDLTCNNKLFYHQNNHPVVPDLLGFSDDDTKHSASNLVNINKRHFSIKLLVEKKAELSQDGVIHNDDYSSNLLENCNNQKEVSPNLNVWCSLPDGLYIQESENKEAGLGVWTDVHLPEGIQFGPNESVMKICDTDIFEEDFNSDYSDSLADDSECSGSNWLRYVNYARDKSHGNLIIVENRGLISYQTSTHIPPGTELLVWHEEDHQNELTTSDECEKSIPIQSTSVSEDLPQTFTCGKCTQIFKSKDDLRRHQRSHRERPKEKRHKCPQCEYAAPRRWELERHLRVHTGEKPFKCHLCERAFNQKGDLGKHLRIHASKRPYECNFCRQTFEQNSELDSHQCPLRPWSFDHIVPPQLHAKQHNDGIAQYLCPHCGLNCASSKDLETHVMFLHSKELSYKCSKCDKGFRTSSYLRRHQRKVHMKKELEGKKDTNMTKI